MKLFLKTENKAFFIQGPYHEKLRDLYNLVKGCTYSSEEGYKFPIEEKNKLVKNILALGVSIEEIQEFPKRPEVQKIVYYNSDETLIELHCKYSHQVVEVFKKYEGKFNGCNRRWSFDLINETELLKDLEEIGYTLEKGNFPKVTPIKFLAQYKKLEDSFELHVPYLKELCEYFKSVGGKFDGITTRWTFPLSQADSVILKCGDYCSCVEKLEKDMEYKKKIKAKYLKI